MKILSIYIGGFDYNRYWGLELALFGLELFLGTAWAYWFTARVTFEWFSGRLFFERSAVWLEKDLIGERVLELLVRRLVLSWFKK